MRPSVLLTRRLFPEAEAILSRRFALIRPRGIRMSRSELLAGVRGVAGILCQLTDPIDRPLLDRAPLLRAVSVCAVGYDNVDVAACARRGVLVAHTPGVLTEATADHTWALLLAAARRVVEGDAVCRRGRFPAWDLEYMLGSRVAGATIGIVGMGRIGRAVARRAAGFDMTILHHSRSRTIFGRADAAVAARAMRAALPALLRRSDVVTLHVPASAATRHLIGERELRLMRPGAILVNTSRGSVVDQRALVEALRRGGIAAAALDVFEDEPKIPATLTRLANVVMTPHVASATGATRLAMATLAARNLAAILSGRPSGAALVRTKN
jgi:lactate dehydrogenase-like 2-hydroxyacid dehydrogenase